MRFLRLLRLAIEARTRRNKRASQRRSDASGWASIEDSVLI